MLWGFTLTALLASATAFDSQRTDNTVLYWGQNSLNQEGGQDRLADYCTDGVDLIVLSFMHIFPSGTGGMPELNFAASCNDGSLFPGTGLLQCPTIAQDIKTCQQRGKTILLSMGGASGGYGFTSDQQARQFADQCWNMFGNGTDQALRPFGDSIVDGFDLDIEGGSATGYAAFTNRMNEHYAENQRVAPCKKYYMACAPQSSIPDYFLNSAISDASMDLILVQFYNNWSQASAWAPGDWSRWNYNLWDELVRTKSRNKDARLFIGVPMSPTAAGSGYVDADTVVAIWQESAQFSTLGGIMGWDASQSGDNTVNGQGFIEYIKDQIKQPGSGQSDDDRQCNAPVPTFTSSTAVSSTTTASSSTLSSSSILSSTSILSSSSIVPASSSTSVSSTEAAATTTSNPNPQPTCPVVNGPCSSNELKCLGNSYAQCVNGAWLQRPCGAGTVCHGGFCTFPSSSNDKGEGASCLDPSPPTPPVETSSSTTSTGSSSTPVPVPIPSSCPVENSACNDNEIKCVGGSYAQCVHGAWMFRPCAAGTVCNGGTCGFPRFATDRGEGADCATQPQRRSLADKCPAIGSKCDGLAETMCMGGGFAECEGGVWVPRPCPSGSVCRTGYAGVCEKPNSSTDKGDNYGKCDNTPALTPLLSTVGISVASVAFQERFTNLPSLSELQQYLVSVVNDPTGFQSQGVITISSLNRTPIGPSWSVTLHNLGINIVSTNRGVLSHGNDSITIKADASETVQMMRLVIPFNGTSSLK